MYVMTRLRPDGTNQTIEYNKRREAGQFVAYCLFNNGYVKSKKEATRLAMECEQTGRIEHAGLWWTITKQK